VLKNFLADHRDREMAQKRGGGTQKFSLDDTAVEASWAALKHGALTPDELFDRKWAESVFQTAAQELRDEYCARNKVVLYEAIKDLVPGQHGEIGYAQLAATLGMTEPAMKNAVHRYRQRQAELIRKQVAATVETPQQLEEELQYLIELLSR